MTSSRECEIVVCTDDVCHGMPRIDGTRLTVYDVVDDLAFRDLDEYLVERELTRQNVLDVLNYCCSRKCEKDNPRYFCDPCSMNCIHKRQSFEEFLAESGPVVTTDLQTADLSHGGLVVTTDGEHLEEVWRGKDGWRMAAEVLKLMVAGES